MSHRKYYGEYDRKPEVVEKTEETVETVETVETENKEELIENEESVETVETTDDALKNDEDQTIIGAVANCIKLNVREKPDINSKSIYVAPKDEVLLVDNEKSIGEWYKVHTIHGLEGYSMKKYVSVD